MPDADDNDTQVNTPESVIHKYGDLRSFLIDGKGYNFSNIYYIALDGDDLFGQPNNPDKPFRHWHQAEGNTQYGVKHLLKPGDVVVYRGGKYDDPGISISSGTEENPIVAMSHPGETVIFDSINVAVSIRGSKNAIVSGFIITNSRNFPWGHGITLGQSSKYSGSLSCRHLHIRSLSLAVTILLICPIYGSHKLHQKNYNENGVADS